MDLRSILNKPDSDTAARAPQRSTSLAQPPLPPGLLHRQQSLPSYPDYQTQAHSPYGQQPEYLRERSLSVSPKTVPTPIPRNPPSDAGYFQEHHLVSSDPGPTSTPTHHAHTRNHSTQSQYSAHSAHSVQSPSYVITRDALEARTYPHHSSITSSPVQTTRVHPSHPLHSPHPLQSPQLLQHSHPIQSPHPLQSPHPQQSPVQARAMATQAALSRHPTQSPVEARAMMAAGHQFVQSPVQTKAMRPPTTPGAVIIQNQSAVTMQTPPPQARNSTPSQASPSSQSQLSIPSVKPSPRTESPKATSRKRSLDSPGRTNNSGRNAGDTNHHRLGLEE